MKKLKLIFEWSIPIILFIGGMTLAFSDIEGWGWLIFVGSLSIVRWK